MPTLRGNASERSLVSLATSGGADDVRDYLQRRCSELPKGLCIEDLVRMIFSGPVEHDLRVTLSKAESPFLECLDHLARRRIRDATTYSHYELACDMVTEITEELDFLENVCCPDQLTALQAACFIALLRVPPRREVAAVLTVRDEGIYLLEWLAYHRLLGISDIFIYTNDNADGSEKLLDALATSHVCHVTKNRIGKGVNPQRKAYQHALLLQPALRDFRWVLFADADEFLFLDCAGSVTLPSFLRALAAHFPNGHPAAVLFPWHWRHTDLAFSRPATFMLDAYPHATFHRNVKSIVNLSQALGMSQVHVPTISEEAFVVDPDCHIVPLERVWDGITVEPSAPRIEHFWAKSFVEFTNKVRRGESLALENGDFRRDIRTFFDWNPPDTLGSWCPVSSETIARVAVEVKSLMQLPGVTAAYNEVAEVHSRWRRTVEQDFALREQYEQLRREARL